MKNLILLILVLFLLGGCASGKFSATGGKAKFSIPFDFPHPKEQNQDSREKKITEEMEKLEQQMGQAD